MAQTRDDLERNMRESPEQYKLLYGVLDTASVASAEIAVEIYDAAGMELPPGPVLFEIRSFLLTDVLLLMARYNHDREVFQAFNAFACHATAFDLHPRLLTNGDLAQIAGERVREYWGIHHSSGDTLQSAASRVSMLVVHLDATVDSPDLVQLEHPIAIGDAIEEFQIKTALRDHYMRVSLMLAHPLNAVFETAKDVRRLSVERMGKLLDSGAEKARAALRRIDEQDR